MKIMNYRRFDPEYTKDGKIGLIRGNKDEEVVWNEFTNNLERLKAATLAIRFTTIEKHINNFELEVLTNQIFKKLRKIGFSCPCTG